MCPIPRCMPIRLLPVSGRVGEDPVRRPASGETPNSTWAMGHGSAGNFEKCLSVRQWDSSSLSEGGRWSRRVPQGGDG